MRITQHRIARLDARSFLDGFGDVIRRTLEGAFETLHITPLHAENVTTDIRKHIMEVLNDYKLRQIIENETHDIRTILYIKAFGDIDENNDEL